MNQAEHAHYRVAVALTPVRSEPSERSEQTTQWHLHQKVEVTDFRPGWCSCVGLRDGYRGWVAEGQLEPAGVGVHLFCHAGPACNVTPKRSG